jgi:hypothetical protein
MVNNTMVVLFPGTGEGLPGWDRLFPGTAGVSPARQRRRLLAETGRRDACGPREEHDGWTDYGPCSLLVKDER